jgi:PAS domain S-box-containing protein
MSPPDADAPSAPVSVLVVDDHAANRAAMRAILSTPEYRVVEAASGPEALRRLLAETFAVLLVDVIMPEMSGLELAEAVRARERTATLPILFLTGQTPDEATVHRAYQAGAVDYLVKPLVPEIVRAKVAVFAELFRQRERLEAQGAQLLRAQAQEAELRLAELRLAGERRYRTLAEAVPHIVWTATPEGAVDYFNRRWFEYTGLSLAEAGGSWQAAVHPADLEACQRAWDEAVRSGQRFEVEARLRQGRGPGHRWHLFRGVPERSSSGQVVSWLGTLTDIEDQKQAALEREVLYREAVDAVRARDEFLSIASHELRTPLQTLKFQLEMLLRGPRRDPGAVLPPEQVKAKLEMASKQVDRLSRLISELMDVSRITSGRLKLEAEALDLAALVQELTSRLAEDAARARSPLQVHAGDPVVGRWDRSRLEQIVTNLVSNALKFGAGKPIEITVERAGQGARLAVSDQGIGIAPKDAERIFQRYEQAISPRAYGGLGLGLYIVRQLVEAHGGSIRVESQPGAGSSFIVELPLEPPASEEARPAATTDERGEARAQDGEAHPHH